MSKVKIFVLVFGLAVTNVLVAQDGPQYRYMRGNRNNGVVDRSLGDRRPSSSGNMFSMPTPTTTRGNIRVNGAKYNDVLKVTKTDRHLVNGDVAVEKQANRGVAGNAVSVNYGRRSSENFKSNGAGVLSRFAMQPQIGDASPVMVQGTEECFGEGNGNGRQKVRRKDDSGLETPDSEEPVPVGDALFPLMLMVLAYAAAVRKK